MSTIVESIGGGSALDILDENVTVTQLWSSTDQRWQEISAYMQDDGLYVYTNIGNATYPQFTVRIMLLKKEAKIYPVIIQGCAGSSDYYAQFVAESLDSFHVYPSGNGATARLYKLADSKLSSHIEYKGLLSANNYNIYIPKSYGSGMYIVVGFNKDATKSYIGASSVSLTGLCVSIPSDDYLMWLPVSHVVTSAAIQSYSPYGYSAIASYNGGHGELYNGSFFDRLTTYYNNSNPGKANTALLYKIV